MKILFLDIDGVMNSAQGYEYLWQKFGLRGQGSEKYCEEYDKCKETFISKGFDPSEAHDIALAREFDPICVSNLKKLLTDVPDLKIVLSSTWRLGYASGPRCGLIFEEHPEIKERFIDRTPRLFDEAGQTRQRGLEIRDWLNRHPEVESFVVFDDDSDMETVEANFIQQDSKVGLTLPQVLDAVRILNKKPWNRPNFFGRTCRSCSSYEGNRTDATEGTCKKIMHLLSGLKNNHTGEVAPFDMNATSIQVKEDFRCPMYDAIPWRGSNEDTFSQL